MLCEFAITAEAFCGCTAQELGDLARCLFHPVSDPVVVVSNLASGTWRDRIVQRIAAIADERLRRQAQCLLKRVDSCCVKRPGHVKADAPDSAWMQEALRTHGLAPLHCIIGTPMAPASGHSVLRTVNSLTASDAEGFWSQVTPACRPTVSIQGQVETLRPILLHSRFLALMTPDLWGRDNDETPFALQILAQLRQRPLEFGPVLVDLHTEVRESPDRQMGDLPRGERIRQKVHPLAFAGLVVRLWLWKKILNRRLLAGDAVERRGAELRPLGARWAVALEHVARPDDRLEQVGKPTWTLLPRSAVAEEYGRYYGNTGGRLVGSVQILSNGGWQRG